MGLVATLPVTMPLTILQMSSESLPVFWNWLLVTRPRATKVMAPSCSLDREWQRLPEKSSYCRLKRLKACTSAPSRTLNWLPCMLPLASRASVSLTAVWVSERR